MEKITNKYSFGLRFWHWLNVVAISGSLSTVLLNSTLLDQKANTTSVSKALDETGAKLAEQPAGMVLHGLREQVWDLHVYAGYLIVVLLAYRLFAGLLERKDRTLLYKLKLALTLYHLQKGPIRGKEVAVKFLYFLFYSMLLFMAVSGLSLKFHLELGLSNPLKHNIEEAHGLVMYLILSFILVHIIGVIIAEKTDKPGIVSHMINGGNVYEQH